MTYSALLAIVVTTLLFNGVSIQRVPTANIDLITLKSVIEQYNSNDIVNVTELLNKFKKSSGLRVSNNDLLTYFSNLGVKFYNEF